MIVKEIKDIHEIRSVLCREDVYGQMSDDLDPELKDFNPHLESVEYIAGYDEDKIIGLMAYIKHDDCTACHIIVLPECRLLFAMKFAREALDYGLNKYKTVYTKIPDYHRGVLNFAKKFGFEVVGIEKNSCKINGKMYDTNIARCDRGIR